MRAYPALACSAAVALACATAPAGAHQILYGASLSGAAEAAPNDSPGTGFTRVLIDEDLATMKIKIVFADLTGATTAAHIHCCTVPPGSGTAGVITQLPSFTGFPAGATSGRYVRTFDLTQAGTYNPSFISANGGTVSGAMNALFAGLDGGGAYLNVHTTTYPAGEIRGFLLTPVPEPGTWALMAAGLAAVGVVARRRRG